MPKKTSPKKEASPKKNASPKSSKKVTMAGKKVATPEVLKKQPFKVVKPSQVAAAKKK